MEKGRGDLNLGFPYEGEKIMPLEFQEILTSLGSTSVLSSLSNS